MFNYRRSGHMVDKRVQYWTHVDPRWSHIGHLGPLRALKGPYGPGRALSGTRTFQKKRAFFQKGRALFKKTCVFFFQRGPQWAQRGPLFFGHVQKSQSWLKIDRRGSVCGNLVMNSAVFFMRGQKSSWNHKKQLAPRIKQMERKPRQYIKTHILMY